MPPATPAHGTTRGYGSEPVTTSIAMPPTPWRPTWWPRLLPVRRRNSGGSSHRRTTRASRH
ncbi:hypothetical protein ACFPM0_28350 [Pseudonocardia sulfidoxydans]|uniref:hypothetical protein n=1 Tax=Pseudonocardia sulfidoxydans TaxID=54011 RepID=UPI0036136922